MKENTQVPQHIHKQINQFINDNSARYETTTDQTIATFQFFDAGINEIQQSSLTGSH